MFSKITNSKPKPTHALNITNIKQLTACTEKNKEIVKSYV